MTFTNHLLLLYSLPIGSLALLWAGLRYRRLSHGVRAYKVQLPPEHQYFWTPRARDTDRLPSTQVLSTVVVEETEPTSGWKGVDHPEIRQPEVPGMERWPAAVDGLVAGIGPAVALAKIDPLVVKALDFSFKSDLTHFGNLRELVAQTHEMSPDSYAGWLVRLKGYVGEQVASDVLTSKGFDVIWPETANNAGWDLLVNGEAYNVKIGQGIDHILDHLTAHPDVGVITSPELAEQLPEIFQDRVIAIPELDHDALLDRTTDTLENVDAVDFGLHVPWFTIAVSSIREFKLIMRNDTDLGTSLKNIGWDALGTGGGGWAGGKFGAVIGTAVAPGVGTVLGGILGAVVGAVAGRSITNSVKMKAYQAALEAYQASVESARTQVDQLHRTLVTDVEWKVRQTEEQLKSEVQAIQHRRHANLQGAKEEFRDRIREFGNEFPSRLLKVEEQLAQEGQIVLNNMQRSHALRRAIWPSEQDIAYRAVERWFQARRSELRADAKRMRRRLAKLSDEAQLQTINEYLERKHLALTELDEALSNVAEGYRLTMVRCLMERNRAEHEVKERFLTHANEVHAFIKGRLSDFGSAVARAVAPVKPLYEQVKSEGRKLGMEL